MLPSAPRPAATSTSGTLRAAALIIAALLALASPAAAQTDTTAHAPPPATPTPRARRNPKLITAEEIAAHPARDAYELVRALRPTWLRPTTAGPVGTQGMEAATMLEPVVFRDGSRMGGLAELRNIPAESISELRFLDGREAMDRWGQGNSAGAILVTSR
jgi:hypothetical protein